MRPRLYVLDGHRTVPVRSEREWQNAFGLTDRHVALTELFRPGGDRLRISTVFLGIDHQVSRHGPPILFETMVFVGRGYTSLATARYATWDEAEQGHRQMLARYSGVAQVSS